MEFSIVEAREITACPSSPEAIVSNRFRAVSVKVSQLHLQAKNSSAFSPYKY